MHDNTLCMLVVGGYFAIAMIVCIIFNIYNGWNNEDVIEIAQFVGFLWGPLLLGYTVWGIVLLCHSMGAFQEKGLGKKSGEPKKIKEVKTTPVPFAQFSLNAEFQCPVCKEVSKTDDHHNVIFCSHCRTPHHVNCYKSIGHCSTYGCHGQKDPATYQMTCECL